MNTIDRHIFKEWLTSFGIAILVILGILVLEDISNNLSDFIDYGASTTEVVRYYIILIPSFLPTILPISILLSILFTLGVLHHNNEIIAMRSLGLSLFTITRGLWLAGFVFTVTLFFLNAKWVPSATESARQIRDNFKFNSQLEKQKASDIGLLYNLTFSNQADRRIWFINRFSELTFEAYGLSIYQKNAEGTVITEFKANKAFYDEYERHWILQSGRVERFNDKGEQIFSLPFSDLTEDIAQLKSELKTLEKTAKAYQIKNNRQLELELILSETRKFQEDPALMKSLRKRPKDLSFLELQNLLKTLDKEADSRVFGYAVRYHSILANPFSCLIIVSLAIPFAVTGVRTNPMVGIAKSVGLFFLYFLIANLCLILGESRIIAPILAAWMPNALMASCALFLYKKAE